LQEKLMRWEGPDDEKVVSRGVPQKDAFEGPLSEFGPDLLVGYNAGFRASSKTGMGEWGPEEIEENQDHWGADHCFDAESVPGVLFSTHDLSNLPNPSYRDIPVLVLGKEIDPRRELAGPTYSDEDQEKINQRLKELGYL
jgi:hypothetical protein